MTEQTVKIDFAYSCKCQGFLFSSRFFGTSCGEMKVTSPVDPNEVRFKVHNHLISNGDTKGCDCKILEAWIRHASKQT